MNIHEADEELEKLNIGKEHVNTLHDEELYINEFNEMVRDFTQIPPRAKSEVARRIQDYANSRIQEFVREVEGLEEYIAVKDNDTHRYQIPKSKKAEWDTFCKIPEGDERGWDVPDFAERIDGMPVKSLKDSVLALSQKYISKDKV